MTSPHSIDTILDTVVWLVANLDDQGLEELHDLPLLELAKHVLVKDQVAA